MTLKLDRLSKRFGGLVAVDDVSLELRGGEILGLIGPNGSGKTTLFNLISGVYAPDEGWIMFEGQDLTGRPPFVVAHHGIARTHQIVQPLMELTVRENVAVGACFGHHNLSLSKALDKADRVLEEVGLAKRGDVPAGKLNLAEKKRLELARALASEPFIVLLDEVLAGLNPTEVDSMLAVIRQVHARGIDIIMVEHLMQAILKLCDRLVVLESGKIIAHGDPQAVMSDPAVVAAYLGDPTLLRELETAA